MSQVINRENYSNKPPFKEVFYTVEPERGIRQVVQDIGNRVVAFVDPQAVVNCLIKYLETNLAGKKIYAFTEKQARDCVKYWIASTPPIEMPKYLGQKDEEGLCFQRLNFNYGDTPNETTVLDELMSRCSNNIALKQYIGSLTVENSSRFQYLWIYGSGGEGKGSLGRGLMNIFGDGSVTMAVPKTDSQKQFLTFSLLGKRLCIFPECSNYQFPQDPLFKQLTGGDYVWFEAKGKMGHSGKINCKFIFLSNDQPGVHGTDANMRRMIYSEIEKPTIKYSASVYDALIAAEMPSFIIKCRQEYLEACPQGEDIQINDPKTKELIDSNEEAFEVLTSKWFIPCATESITPARMHEIKELEDMDQSTYRRWVSYLKSKLGVHSEIRHWDGNDRPKQRRWIGIRERTTQEAILWTVEKNSSKEVKDDDNATATRVQPELATH